MKKIKISLIAIILLFVFSNSMLAQNPMQHGHALTAQRGLIETTDVPQLVKDTQQKVFPGTNVEKWFTLGNRGKSQNPNKNTSNQNNPVVFVAQFKNNEGFNTHCRITETGDMRGYMVRLEGEKGLPANIKETIQKRFPNYTIQASQKIYSTKNNSSAYRVILSQNSNRVITFVDEKGNEIKEENMEPSLKENILTVPDKNSFN